MTNDSIAAYNATTAEDDVLASTRIDQRYSGDSIGVKNMLTTVPVRKPSKREFVRVHPEHFHDHYMADLKAEREAYFLTKDPNWITGREAWDEFVTRHPELGYRPGKWAFHNFLRYHRNELAKRDAIRLAKRRFWVAHRMRFERASFDLATGGAPAWIADAPDTAVVPHHARDARGLGAGTGGCK